MQATPQLKRNQIKKREICKIFSKRFREMRNSRDLTLVNIADKLGISRQSIVYYAMGDRIPNIVILIQLSELLGSSVDYLIGQSDTPF